LPLEWESVAPGLAGAATGALLSGFITHRLTRKRTTEDLHVGYASAISAWYEAKPITDTSDGIVVIANDSEVAAHKIIITFLIGKGSHAPRLHTDPDQPVFKRWIVRSLPPGKWKFPCPAPWRGMFGDGVLAEVDLDAFAYYGLEEPFGLDALQPYDRD
jgi:hypothetical protein